MKVILLQDVSGIGRRFEVQDVPKGHALNFLIPKKMAEPATKGGLKRLQKRTEKIASDQAQTESSFIAALKKLARGKIEMALPANEKGSLFESVKPEDIAKRLSDNGISVLPDHILITSQIKETGEHSVELHMGENRGTFTLLITPE